MTRPFTAEEAARSFRDDPSRPDVWIFDRTTPEFAGLAERGPVAEDVRLRAGRLRSPAAGAFLLARRAALRRVLGLYLARPPGDVRLVTLPGGKPALVPDHGDARSLSFSTAQSRDLFCLAVGSANSLGIDVEVERLVARAEAIAARWFSAEESMSVRAATPEARSGVFFRLWTGKEALAKRHSAGLRLLRRGVDELDVQRATAERTLVHFAPRQGYVAALASTTPIADLRVLGDPSLG